MGTRPRFAWAGIMNEGPLSARICERSSKECEIQRKTGAE